MLNPGCRVAVVAPAGIFAPERLERGLERIRAWGLEPNSRLSCQAILGQQDVTVEIPKYSINHAKEKH